MSPFFSRLLTLLLCLLGGAFFGAAGSFGQAITVGGWLPFGAIVALIGALALILALRLLTGSRWNAVAGAVGIMFMTWLLSMTSPGGSVVFADLGILWQVSSYIWMLGVPLGAALVVAFPDLRRIRPAADVAPESEN